jgi:hypothetical protein
MKSNKTKAITNEAIITKIYLIRGQKVMIDADLAYLYQVETKRLKESVKRNLKRFPPDFMFKLTRKEFENLRSQIATSSWGGQRYLPMAFTEQGVAMLSSILNSSVAIQVNIQIIRTFTAMRKMLLTNKDILLKLEQLDRKVTDHDKEIQIVFKYLKQLLNPPPIPRVKIGFKHYDKD